MRTEETNGSDIAIRIDDGPLTPDFDGRSRGWKAILVLDPEDRDVTVFTCIGSGTPMSVWHNRALGVAVNEAAAGESVRAILEDHRNQIDAIFATYQGTRWDGSAHVGQWSTDESNVPEYALLLEALELALESASAYWSAGDWLGGDWSGCKRELANAMAEAGDDEDRDAVLDRVAAQWVEEGKSNDALLDLADVRRQIDRMVEQLDKETDETP